MTLQEVQNLTIQQIKKIPEPELRKIVSQTATSLNKRIINIKYNKKASQVSVMAVQESGGKFKTSYQVKNKKGKLVSRPMNKKQLITELKREKSFMQGVASTVKKAKEFKKTQQKTAGGQTADEYAKKKARRARKKRAEQIKIENKAWGRKKYTKKQKEELDELYKKIYKESEEAYDKKVGEAWDAYHNWKEINQIDSRAIFEEGSTIQEMVTTTAFMSDEDRDEFFKQHWEKYVEEDEKKYHESLKDKPDLGDPYNLKERMEEIAEQKSEVDEIADLITETGGTILH